jgi:hypothetical protein
MTISGRGYSLVTTNDLKPAMDALRTVDKALAKEWRTKARRELAVPWARELAAQAPGGSKGEAAGRSVKAGTGMVPTIWAAKGEWNGWQPFFALEFGMSHSKWHTYVRRSANGGRHFVRRRSGTWAPVHAGRRGHWFYPYWRANDHRLTARVAKMLNAFIEEHL